MDFATDSSNKTRQAFTRPGQVSVGSASVCLPVCALYVSFVCLFLLLSVGFFARLYLCAFVCRLCLRCVCVKSYVCDFLAVSTFVYMYLCVYIYICLATYLCLRVYLCLVGRTIHKSMCRCS